MEGEGGQTLIRSGSGPCRRSWLIQTGTRRGRCVRRMCRICEDMLYQLVYWKCPLEETYSQMFPSVLSIFNPRPL